MSDVTMQGQISEEDLAEHWFSFMHDVLGELRAAYKRAKQMDKITQHAIAQRLGADPGYISRCLSGQQNMTIRTMSNVARAMGCRPTISFQRLADLPRSNSTAAKPLLEIRGPGAATAAGGSFTVTPQPADSNA